ncbi:MAG TPA: DoxX family protein [Anaerolineaceae bacterium]|nr:DoxX family protein [Anaerolineaceae bacterium]
MNIALWILQSFLALIFLITGSMKLARSKEQLAVSMHWVDGVSPLTIKAIGSVEILGALGLILPAVTGILPWLTPLAGAGLALAMLVASFVHAQQKEYSGIGLTALLLALSAFTAYGRFFIRPL